MCLVAELMVINEGLMLVGVRGMACKEEGGWDGAMLLHRARHASCRLVPFLTFMPDGAL